MLDHTLNLLALGFALTLSTVLIWFVDWRGLDKSCLLDGTCDLSTVLTTRYSFTSRDSGVRGIVELV